MNIGDRLLEFRESKKLTMKEIAKALEITESYYSMIESGKRNPSKKVIYRLISYTNLPEEYWLNGILPDEYSKKREPFKSLKEAVKYINEQDIQIDYSNLFKNIENLSLGEQILLTALRSDLSYK